jgi:nucleotide-binding universal stress UspA family protein
VSTVVVGYDGSEPARGALAAAIEVSGFTGDRIIVVFAYEISRLGGEVQDYAKAVRERAEREIGHARHQGEAAGVEIETEIIEAEPAEALVKVASEADARLIVVGSRGERPLRAMLLGSTPYRLLHMANRPVLVVPG